MSRHTAPPLHGPSQYSNGDGPVARSPDGPYGTTSDQPTALPDQRQHLIEQTAARIRELVFTSTMQLTLRVGEIIVEGLYGGSFKAWRKRGRKCNSLRVLASRPDLPMSATAIYRSVAIYELMARVGGPQVFAGLSVTHYRAVLRLPLNDQVEYLRIANAQRLTATQLEERTRTEYGPGQRGRGGRRPMNPIQRAVRSASRALHAQLPGPSEMKELATDPHLREVQTELQMLLSRVLDLADAVGVAVPPRTTTPEVSEHEGKR